MPNGTPSSLPNAEENFGKIRPDSFVLRREFGMVADIDQDVIEGCQRGDEAAFMAPRSAESLLEVTQAEPFAPIYVKLIHAQP